MRPIFSSKRSGVQLALLLLTVAIFGTYANSFRGAFLLDDQESILNNRSLRNWSEIWAPPAEAGVGRRPLLNATFAINYHISGLNPWSYHALNVLIHLATTFVLFGILYTVAKKIWAAEEERALTVTFFVVLLWSVDPIQTESVTYISQRAEELSVLFYLLTVYTFLRSQADAHSSQWKVASVICCLLGALTKQTIVTAPLLICFLGYENSKRQRTKRNAFDSIYYIGLFASWVVVAYSSIGLNRRGAGFDQNLVWWKYAFISSRSLLVYLRLALCPYPLVFDYGVQNSPGWPELAVNSLIIGACLLSAVLLFRKHRWAAWLILFFFLVLAPTSSIIPVSGQPIAENRLYLPVVVFEIFIVLGVYAASRRYHGLFLGGLSACFILLSIQRNQLYASELAVWKDTVSKVPTNVRAVANLGVALLDATGDANSARPYFEEALRLDPMYAIANSNLGSLLMDDRRTLPQAVVLLERALYSNPGYKDAQVNLGVALSMQGRTAEAISHFDAAVMLDPYDGSIYFDRALAYLQSGKNQEEGRRDLRKCLSLQPDFEPAKLKLSTLRPQEQLPAPPITGRNAK